MDKNKNSYIILYAAIMTVIVAVVLAFVASSLKPNQMANELYAKKQDILKSVGATDVDVNEFFATNIEGVALTNEGEIIEGVDAIDINIEEELRNADLSRRRFPIYIYTNEEGTKNYIVPLQGNGLWGRIWGYIALDDDLNTIVGASFDHQTETPGLGAEIAGEGFQSQFINKEIYRGDQFVGITVKKGNLDQVDHQVQGISGSTITGDGVTAMIKKDLRYYLPYFDKLKN